MMSGCPNSLFILADDLTGAADCAMGAARKGLHSIVLFEPTVAAEAQVISIDADTRYCAPEVAREICNSLWRTWAAPGRLLYKKIDSTLRGNFAAEISAFADVGVAIVAPAFPSVGRTMRNGRVFVHGVPLEATDIWSKECMDGVADVVAMLQAEGVKAVNLPLDIVRGDLRAALKQLVEQDAVQAIVCDALTDADLEAVAGASVGLPVYWVGSAGLVAHLPAAAGLTGCAKPITPTVSGSIVTVVGSLSPVSRQQAQNLEAGVDLALFEPAPVLLRAGSASSLWQSTVEAIGQALALGRDVLIRTGTFGDDDLSQGHILCQALGQLLLPLAPQIGALVVTGGETARALLPAFGTHSLQLLQEVEPGVPLSVSIGTRSLPVVTKAGAFGSPDALLNAHRMLARLRASTMSNI